MAHQDIWKPEWVGVRAAQKDPRVPGAITHWNSHGVQAQNYHIMTPYLNKDWAMAWGSPTWIKDFPHANRAQSYSFKPGQGGTYRLEFYITPYDYAGPEGPERAVETKLREDALIALGWMVIDYDDVGSEAKNGSGRCRRNVRCSGWRPTCRCFALMPVEATLLPKLESRWSWKVVDMDRRLVAFHDDSVGRVTSWHWDFGDGSSSDRAASDPCLCQAGQLCDDPRRDGGGWARPAVQRSGT